MSKELEFMPLVMGLRSSYVKAMLCGRKTVELRRRVPADELWLDDKKWTPWARKVCFVEAGLGKGNGGNPLPRVRVAADVAEVQEVNLREFFIPGNMYECEATFLSYRTQDRHRAGITWGQAMDYQGMRESIWLIFLENAHEVNIPVFLMGLKGTPQGYAWSKCTLREAEKKAEEFWNSRKDIL